MARLSGRKKKAQAQLEEQGYVSRSQAQMIWQAFRRHRVGNAGTIIVLLFLVVAIFAQFIGPYSFSKQFRKHPFSPPTTVHWRADDGSLSRPYVYATQRIIDKTTYRVTYVEDVSKKYYVRFFVSGGSEHNLLGFIPMTVHLFAARADDGSEASLFVFGTDMLGRDLFTRVLVGSWVSLAVGPLVILLSFPLGILLGGISGYYGGGVDMFIQRACEVMLAIPGLPILMAMGAALRGFGLSAMLVFFGVIGSLAIINWGGMARIIRGQVLAIREMDFVTAARAAGATDLRIVVRHIVPNVTSYLIVAATLTIPGMMLTEAALSFLGYGIQEPMTSWGQLLSAATNIGAMELHPWVLIPGAFIVVSVLAFNFMGDALRDAVDPYSIL
ncbi:ABC transporter permease [Candidatus Bipolaricaulota bacterium]|nr:ABC transporter permease [Candidatus Bipolaricaulota bacterium]